MPVNVVDRTCPGPTSSYRVCEGPSRLASLDSARGILDSLDAPTCAVGNDGRIVVVNDAWAKFTGANNGREASTGLGTDYLTTCEAVADDSADRGDASAVAGGLRSILAGVVEKFEHEYPCHSPLEERWFVVRIAPADVEGSSGAVISHLDVTALHEARESLEYQTKHDALTGLSTRRDLTARVDRSFEDLSGASGDVAVAYLGIDRFKRINERFGHQYGDALLAQVGHRLLGLRRPGDSVARYSSDEFAVAWRNTSGSLEVAQLSEALVASLRDPFDVNGYSVTLTASVGVAPRGHAHNADELLLCGIAAMREAKHRGGDCVIEFDDAIARSMEQSLIIEDELRDAIERSELVLHYQPVIELATGKPVGVEALVRWDHPERGRIGPGQFIPLAESSGLIAPLGEWVLNQACRDAAAFTGAAEGLHVAVNLSTRQITDSRVVEHVREALATSGLDPQRLFLEVTESTLMQDEMAADTALRELTELGARVSIDDFGTGYSSLLYLRRYPVSVLKLDQAFVSGLSCSDDDEAICRSVVGLADALSLTSIAEGVETQDQAIALRSFGCMYAQGFLWARAVPVEELTATLLACGSNPIGLATGSTWPASAHLVR